MNLNESLLVLILTTDYTVGTYAVTFLLLLNINMYSKSLI